MIFIPAALGLSACGVVPGLSEDETSRTENPTASTTPTIIANESYAGLVGKIELAAVYSPQHNRFVGRIRNESSRVACDLKVRFFVDDVGEFDEPLGITATTIEALGSRGRHSFAVDVPPGKFSTWVASIEQGRCSDTQLATSLQYQSASEESHEENGDRGRGEHGGEERNREHSGEHQEEGNEESNPPVLVNQPYRNTHQSLDFDVAFDANRGMFQGHITNVGSRMVCRTRVEIHVTSNDELVELGPTIPVHLAPKETIHFALDADDRPIDTYWIHPERSRCR